MSRRKSPALRHRLWRRAHGYRPPRNGLARRVVHRLRPRPTIPTAEKERMRRKGRAAGRLYDLLGRKLTSLEVARRLGTPVRQRAEA